MRRRAKCAWLVLLLLVWAASAQAQKVKIEYDTKADFTQYKTYSWAKLVTTAHPYVQADIVAAIDQQLRTKGLKNVASGGDLLVNSYDSLSEGMNVSYDVNIYAMPGLDTPITWANGTPRPGNSTAVYVDKGTLVVDLVDRQAKGLKWRGTAKLTLDPARQEKSLEIIEKAIVKMFRDFPVHP